MLLSRVDYTDGVKLAAFHLVPKALGWELQGVADLILPCVGVARAVILYVLVVG